jgi:putative methyltransferase (TIGR04325 family)
MELKIGHNEVGNWETAKEISTQIGIGWNSDTWVEKEFLSAQRVLSRDAVRLTGFLLPFQLSLVAALARAFADIGWKENYQVLDFGGGSGTHLVSILGTFFPALKYTVTIIEEPSICRSLSQLNSNWIRWYESIPAKLFDVAIASGSLQYLKNYREPLLEMFDKSKFLCIDRLPLLPVMSGEVCFVQVAKTQEGQIRAFPTYGFGNKAFTNLVEEHLPILHSWQDSGDSLLFKGKPYYYSGLLAGKS